MCVCVFVCENMITLRVGVCVCRCVAEDTADRMINTNGREREMRVARDRDTDRGRDG